MFLCLLSQQIPNNTFYLWMVINRNDGIVIESLNSSTDSEIIFSRIFTSAGTYEITVQGWNYQSQTLLLNATTVIIIAS